MNNRSQESKEKYEGTHYFTKDTGAEYFIKEYNKSSDVIIEFTDSGFTRHTNMGNIMLGNIPDPFAKSCIAFRDPVAAMIGCYFKTNQGYMIRIIAAKSLRRLTYQFQDEFGYIGTTTYQNISKGQIRNPYHRLENGGYVGYGPYNTSDYKWLYNIWNGLVNRGTGYRKKYHDIHNDNFIANSGISDEFMCYSTFAEWYIAFLSILNSSIEYDINKDILFPVYSAQSNGIHYYSSETCELIPKDLNLILRNNNQCTNPSHDSINTVSALADKYYSEKALTERAYYAIKRFFCRDQRFPVPQCYITPYNQANIRKNNICLEA